MQNYQILRVMLALTCLIIIIAGMKAASTLLVPFLLAGFITIACAPLMGAMTRHRIPAWLAVLIIVLMLLSLFMVSLSLLGASTAELADNIPTYRDKFKAILKELVQYLNSIGLAVDQNLMMYLEPSSALAWLGELFTGLRKILVNFILIIFVVAFALLEAHTMPAKFERAFGSPDAPGYLARFATNVKRYLVIKAWISLATGIMIGLMVWGIGLDYPLLWGLLAFFLNFVPSIGSFLAALPAVAVALATGGWWLTLQTAVIFIFANTLVGNVIEPRVMGHNMGLSPLVVFSSLIVWGWVLGPVGIFLAVPLTMVLHIALQSHHDTRRIAQLLGK